MPPARPPLPELTRDELLRYARHLALPEVGLDGQRRLRSARVLLIGAGGLGSPAALYLAAAGLGRIGIVDFDAVDVSNLQRQVLHGSATIGRLKVESARERLRDLNPHVEVVPHPVRLTSENALGLLADYDLVVDGTDNFATRYLVNDACVLLGKPNVYASVHRFEGQASVLCAPGGPCYRCVHPVPPAPGTVPSCAEGGVLGILPGLLGMMQATEAVKLVTGLGEPLVGRLLLVDALRMEFRTIRVRRDPACPACGTREIRTLGDYEAFCGAAREGTSMPGIPTITVTELVERRKLGDPLTLLDVREPHEWAIGRIEGAQLVPLRTLPDALGGLERERDVVVYCRTGARSARAVAYLQQVGFPRVWNLAGGIHAWSDQVDPSIPKY